MTKKGYDDAVERLKYLQTVKRQEIVERIAEARSHGDLSENAEYDAARNEQTMNEIEINELDFKIKNAVILEENHDTTIVHIGSKVKVYDEDMDEEEVTSAKNAKLNFSIMNNNVAVKGNCLDVIKFNNKLEKAEEYYDHETMYKSYINEANEMLDLYVYYKGTDTKQAYVSLEPF